MHDGCAICTQALRPQQSAPFSWIDLERCSWCNALRFDLPGRRLKGTARPGISRYRGHQTERDVAEQGLLGTAGWQMDADARNMLDDACSNLNELLAYRREATFGHTLEFDEHVKTLTFPQDEGV